MQRRSFIKGGIATGVTLGTGTGIWASIEPYAQPLTTQATLAKLDLLSATSISKGQWDLYQILIHCAQSVEMSMTGYPQHKPDWFKNSLGKLAFSGFSNKGKMHHPLSEAIPGAAAIEADGDIHNAMARFKTALVTFEQWQGPFAPHFAYGPLTRQEYQMAHAMHFNNHLLEIQLTAT